MLSGLMIAILASERGEFFRILPVVIVAGMAMAGVQYLLATHGLWQIGSLAGGLAGLGAIFGMVWLIRRKQRSPSPPPDRKFLWGLAGYGLLLTVILCAQWIPPLRAALQSVQWRAAFPPTSTSLGFSTAAESGKAIAPLGHPGALLVYASFVVALIFSRLGFLHGSPLKTIIGNMVRRAVPVSIGIFLMVGISTIYSQSGMMARLAEGVGRTVGGAFPAVAPWLAGLGAFLTGSNTNSNLLFAPLQQRMAQALGLPEKTLLAAQTAGGAVGSVISPAKVGLGSNAFRGSPGEGEMIRALLAPIAVLLIALSLGAVLML
jgi:lactate permease